MWSKHPGAYAFYYVRVKKQAKAKGKENTPIGELSGDDRGDVALTKHDIY